jgi:DNA-binding XRE family transcriptional regulator
MTTKLNKLKAWRIYNNYSQSEMANLLNVSEITYIRYENFRKKSLNIKVALKLLEITKGEITANDLIGFCNNTIEKAKHNNYKLKIKTKGKVKSHHYNQKHQELVKKLYAETI